MIALNGTALGSALNGAPVLAGIALPFIVVFLLDTKKHWWALIPAWVMTAITFVVLFERQMGDALTGAFVLFSIALPFFVVFFMNAQKNWWAVIPACVMGFIALAVLLERYLGDNLMGAVCIVWHCRAVPVCLPVGPHASMGADPLRGDERDRPDPADGRFFQRRYAWFCDHVPVRGGFLRSVFLVKSQLVGPHSSWCFHFHRIDRLAGLFAFSDVRSQRVRVQ